MSHSGQSLLTLVILIGGIIFSAGVAIALATASFSNSIADRGGVGRGIEGAAVQDAKLQLIRNNTFSSGGYPLTVGSTTVLVTVTQGSPTTGFATISVAGIGFNAAFIVAINSLTGQPSFVSWSGLQ